MSRKLDDYGDILSSQDVRAILNIGANQVYNLLKTGKIKNFKVGSVRKIPKWCLREYIDDAIADIHTTPKENVYDSSSKD